MTLCCLGCLSSGMRLFWHLCPQWLIIQSILQTSHMFYRPSFICYHATIISLFCLCAYVILKNVKEASHFFRTHPMNAEWSQKIMFRFLHRVLTDLARWIHEQAAQSMPLCWTKNWHRTGWKNICFWNAWFTFMLLHFATLKMQQWQSHTADSPGVLTVWQQCLQRHIQWRGHCVERKIDIALGGKTSAFETLDSRLCYYTLQP